jgi:ABC-2 type transport system permease protein
MSTPPRGIIYDQGYRGYEGLYRGRGHALWTMIWADFQRAWGIKKSWKYKWGLGLLVVFHVAAMLLLWMLSSLPEMVGLRVNEEMPYFVRNPFSGYFDWINLPLLILSAMIAADLLCNDRRYRVIPLYLARPIERSDYLLAKSVAIIGFLLVVIVMPVILLFALKLFRASEGALEYLKTHTRDAGALFVSSMLYALYYGAFAMAASAVTVSRGYAVGGAIGVGVTSGVIAFTLFAATQNPYLFYLLPFNGSVAGLKHALFGTAEPIRLPAFNGAITLQPLDPWIYGWACVSVIVVCGMILYTVYRREGL